MRIHRIAVSFLLLLAYFAAGTAVAGESFTLPKSVEEANNKYWERRHNVIQYKLNQMHKKAVANKVANKDNWKAALIGGRRIGISTESIMNGLAALRDKKKNYGTYSNLPPSNFPDTVVEAVKDAFETSTHLLGTRSEFMWAGKPGDLDMDFARVMTLLLEFDETYLKPEARAHIVRLLFNIKKDHTLSINTSKYLLNQYVHEQLKGNTETGKLLREAGFKETSKYDPAKLTHIRDWILQACARILHNDLFETNARPYQGITFLPLFNTFAYANDITLKNAARNAMDAITAKIAFQSYQGIRYPPIRRSHQHIEEYLLVHYDEMLSIMGLFSGARPGLNFRGHVGDMLHANE